MATTPEGRVKTAINKVLKRFSPELYYFMPVPGGFGKPTLDYIGVFVGHPFAIEAKRPGGKPTDRQQGTITEMENAGIKVFIIDGDTSDLEIWLAQVILSVTTTVVRNP